MIIKDLTITNSKGRSISFNGAFKLADDFIMSGLEADVNYSESTQDGSNYQNTKIVNREFNLPFFIRKPLVDSFWIEEQRNLAYQVFNPKFNPFRLDITTKAGNEYYLNANLEGSPLFPVAFEDDNYDWLNGILEFSCGDPFFYKGGYNNSTSVNVAIWEPRFEFPLDISTETDGIELGTRAESLIVNVENSGQDSTGMFLRFAATGSLVNPSIVNVDTLEGIKVNTSMEAGDVIEISTFKRNKYVRLTREGVTTNIFNRLDLESRFLQLEVGDNFFTYNATENVENLEVNISFVPRYLGV